MKTRKELKEDYKQVKPIMGVFQIENKANGKVLIEASINILAKWNRHQTELKFGSHRNKNLQKDWNTFQAEQFNFKILSELEYKPEENVDYTQEVKTLKEMVLEELKLSEDLKY